MRAAVFKDFHKPLEIEQLPDPTPAPGEVVLAVKRCGICGSDLHMTEDPAYGAIKGCVLGHEFAGEVVALGKNVQQLREGDLVSAIPLKSCGHCPSCLQGELAWCKSMTLQGGGFGEFTSIQENQCVAIPSGLTVVDGAILEPLSVALHGANLANLRPSEKVVVIGAGPIGLATAFWARRLGAARVVVVDLVAEHAERSKSVGATDFVLGGDGVVERVTQTLGGLADVVFECVGVPGLIAQSIEHAKVKGRVVVLGLCAKPDEFIPFLAVAKEVRIQMSAFFTRQEYQMSLNALESGAVEPRHLVTNQVTLNQLPAKLESLKKTNQECKVIVDLGN